MGAMDCLEWDPTEHREMMKRGQHARDRLEAEAAARERNMSQVTEETPRPETLEELLSAINIALSRLTQEAIILLDAIEPLLRPTDETLIPRPSHKTDRPDSPVCEEARAILLRAEDLTGRLVVARKTLQLDS